MALEVSSCVAQMRGETFIQLSLCETSIVMSPMHFTRIDEPSRALDELICILGLQCACGNVCN